MRSLYTSCLQKMNMDLPCHTVVNLDSWGREVLFTFVFILSFNISQLSFPNPLSLVILFGSLALSSLFSAIKWRISETVCKNHTHVPRQKIIWNIEAHNTPNVICNFLLTMRRKKMGNSHKNVKNKTKKLSPYISLSVFLTLGNNTWNQSECVKLNRYYLPVLKS